MKASEGIREGESAGSADEQAAHWLVCLDREGLLAPGSDVDSLAAANAEFGAWIAENAGRRTAFLRVLFVWRRADRLTAFAEPKPDRKAPQRSLLAAAAAITVCALAGIGSLVVMNGSGIRNTGAAGIAAANAFETGLGSRETISLADGSVVELNTDSLIIASVTTDQRLVDLQRGEAYFEIAHDPGRPFVVQVGGERVTVLGTKFSVHRLDHGIEVVVTEGRVQIDEGAYEAPPTFVTVGQKAVTAAGSVLVESRDQAAAARDMSWRKGRLEFRETPLSSVAAEFNRYNSIKLVIVGEDTSAIQIGGSFKATNVEAFSRLLSDGMGLAVDRDGDEIRVSAR